MLSETSASKNPCRVLCDALGFSALQHRYMALGPLARLASLEACSVLRSRSGCSHFRAGVAPYHLIRPRFTL